MFGPKFSQKWILGSKFQKSKSGFGIRILEVLGAPISRQNKELWIFGPKFAQKWIWGRNLKTLNLDLESTPPIYNVCQCSFKIGNF